MIRIDDRLYDAAHFDAATAWHAASLGLETRPHERTAVCFEDTAEWLALFFALRAHGGSVLPIHGATPYPAARRLAETAGCHRLFYRSLEAETLPGAAAVEGNGEGYGESEGQLLQMSSGTTGAPKCVARSWREIDTEIERYVASFAEPADMTPVVACPTTHSYGLICGLLVALRRGQVPVVLDAVHPGSLLKRLGEIERPLLYSSPAVLHALARLMPEGERLHATMTSGTLLPDAWFAAIRAKSRHMFQQYGCSETGCLAINPDVTAAADMGRALPHHRLEAGTNADSPAEIVAHGAGGTVRTRDLGHIGPDGMLVFVARLDDTINVSGLNVYPGEVENVVMAMPAVSDAVAFRKPDRFAGERVGLVFSAEGPVAPQAVREWCAGRLAGHQLPTEIVQVATVPRQANGKVSRREVAALHASGALSPAFRAKTAEASA